LTDKILADIVKAVATADPNADPNADRSEFATPTLMRSARGVYAQSVRAQLHAIGIDDLPRNGAFILAGIDPSGGPRQDLPAELGVTKQAVSLVIDVLVNRGYLERHSDPGDRRRVVLELTARGQDVVDATVRGVAAVDRELQARVPPGQIDAMRSTLIALTEIKLTGVSTGAGRRRPAPELRRDLGAALAHYATLGFHTVADAGEAYGFARRDGIGLHLAVHDAPRPGSAYLYVRDADAIYQEWSRPGIAGHTHPAGPTPYRMREGSHVDPDGNLIRFGSPQQD
jgi:DNA-binding MarR family transcriptional regulator